MSEKQTSFNGDRPIEVPAEDRLGFRPAAKHVADAIYCMASPDGFVIGVEGEWGSGKSSFINLVADSLKRYELAPEIVRFLPWLISSREGLLRELFPEIIKAAFRIESREAPVGWRAWLPKFLGSYRYSFLNLRRKKLKRLFSKFSGRLVQAGKLADLAGLPGSGAATQAGTPEDLPALPDLTSILFAWAQYDKDSLDEVRAKAGSLTERDRDFILALEKMRGWSSTNGEVSFPLRERELSRFFDFDALVERLRKLSEDSSVPALAARAGALLSHVDRSED